MTSSAASRCCAAPRSRASGRRTAPGSGSGSPDGYDVMVEMDADLSHDPAVLPELVARGRAAAPTSPSGRATSPGGSIPDWKWLRRADLAGRLALRAHRCSGSRCRTPPPGSVPTTARTCSRDRPRPGPGRRLRLPGGDDLPHRAQRRPHRRGADRVPRPQARAVEDVEAHRGRGAAAGHLVGHPGPARAGTRSLGCVHARH